MPEPSFATDQTSVSENGVKEEKCLSTISQSNNNSSKQSHALSDECRSPMKSECSTNGDTETTVWIRCDVYDTGIGIPGIFSIFSYTESLTV